jgi:hypothetical protein
MAAMAVSMIVVTVSLNLPDVQGMPYVSIGCVILYVIGFAIGLGKYNFCVLVVSFFYYFGYCS